MCGICGICSPTTPIDAPPSALSAMLGAIAHRGPDAQGEHLDPHAALGARRLAIIDLQGGDQPIYSENRAICAVYNGEIYNYRELGAKLTQAGHRLASRSDSEILVHLYEERGVDLVHDLNGMFAFGLWDAPRRTLHLARDRLGVKPLYYSWDGSRLLFASEVKSLLASALVSPALDLDAFVELLTFQNVVSDRSLFRGVSVLPPGSVLTVDPTGLRRRFYWDPLPDPRPVKDRNGVPHEVRERFEAAVERQLVSDVEVASYLSGGLDTGAVTAVASGPMSRLTTFCAGFDTRGVTGLEAGFDEREDARGLATWLRTHHHELLLDAHDMEMVMPRLVQHLEEPRMSFSYPNYLTAGIASRWVKVVLSGVGGDELFGGYPWRYALADHPDFPANYFGYWERLLAPAELGRALTPAVLQQVDLERPRAVFGAIMEPAAHLPALDRILYTEARTFLHGLLMVEDKVSMAHSLESRVPFLDNDLVDYVLTLPAEVKLEGSLSKDLFRQAMRGRLPEEVISRRKTGFTPPQAAWFQGSQAGYVREILLSDRARDRGVLRVEFVEEVLEEYAAGRRDYRLLLWTLLCMEWWHRIFLDGEHAT